MEEAGDKSLIFRIIDTPQLNHLSVHLPRNIFRFISLLRMSFTPSKWTERIVKFQGTFRRISENKAAMRLRRCNKVGACFANSVENLMM